jgi:pimeloyl-ACP methyl ester carboxylesterase
MSDRAPILLIPGLNCTVRLFAGQMAQLSSLGPVLIADHRRGDSIETIASEILAVAPTQFAVVGFSLGGYIAFEIMRRTPDRVARLALLGTSARADTEEQIKRRRKRMAMAERGLFLQSVEDQFAQIVHRTRREDAALRRAYLNMAAECGADAFVAHLNASIHRPDSRATLGSIKCPTLVIVGEDDQVTPAALAEEISNGIEKSSLLILPGSGHLSPLEQPELVAQALVNFLRG